MNVRMVRRLALATAPLFLAAGMMGVTTLPATALPRDGCADLIDEVYTDWGLADLNTAHARDAYSAGNVSLGNYYTGVASTYNALGDSLYNVAIRFGCR
jgi:hypothetical protein